MDAAMLSARLSLATLLELPLALPEFELRFLQVGDVGAGEELHASEVSELLFTPGWSRITVEEMKNDHANTARWWNAICDAVVVRTSIAYRQLDGDNRTHVGSRGEGELPIMQLKDAPADGKAQSQAVGLCCVKGFRQPGQMVGHHACSGIPDFDFHAVVYSAMDRDGEHALAAGDLGHSVDRVLA